MRLLLREHGPFADANAGKPFVLCTIPICCSGWEPGEEETEDWIVRRSTPEQIRRTLRALVREGAPQ